jgi:hypothetical protein
MIDFDCFVMLWLFYRLNSRKLILYYIQNKQDELKLKELSTQDNITNFWKSMLKVLRIELCGLSFGIYLCIH